ncbi:hypothetical protein A4E84_00350 [Streptomyces qaidamensis]|uniref:Uncharacterized protein n=1 Tax=Streptomyces qaidamensis TaxID=1783515 RepID=A0A143BTH8_9ACTN|nr:hypothetical protein A4E84_00350 [Streptomyces qaidamensis]
MTETASGPARSSRLKSGKASKGLRVERIHTTPGVHPYDEVGWERRDVVMTNWRDGSVNFEQRGVEFPDFWSVNAVNIVTSKYFRGAVGTPQRETSLKQLIDRTVKTYRKAGEDHKYFASPADAEIFEHELAYALLHQIFSFNSPVGFNVGTKQPQQVSACFILSVDDSMESILDWYKEEGMIFKGGSGAGLNLSRIRSSKELLSSGGNASGPVSFMRGADASAGTIKSGGATRRAAKMVVLDVDHPDIEDFIETKVKGVEEILGMRHARRNRVPPVPAKHPVSRFCGICLPGPLSTPTTTVVATENALRRHDEGRSPGGPCFRRLAAGRSPSRVVEVVRPAEGELTE